VKPLNPRKEASPSPNDVPAAPEGAFSIVVIPDTQDYLPGAPQVFSAEIQWVLDNLVSQRIRFVSHVGDVVNDCRSAAEWRQARELMLRLDGRIPFGFSVGNRDMAPDGDSTAFQAAFPESLFHGRPWYGGGYKNNADSFQFVAAEGVELLILHLECNAPDDVLECADSVLVAHRDCRAIVVCHMYLGPLERPTTPEGWFTDPKGRMRWVRRHGERGNSPQQIWEKCLRKHENIFLVCCGDQSRTQTMRQTSTGLHGNTVYECLSDYRDGYLRIYRFEPRAGWIDVFTYSPYLRRLCEGTPLAPDVASHRFRLPFAF
jgi:hypothetical protein